MSDLTRAEVENKIAFIEKVGTWRGYEHIDYDKDLLRVLNSWLTLEARVRELEEAEHELKEKLLKAE